ncbi:MAG: PilZ domain-containing protein [Lachnospiraceae bacterium]|nr:PilZ domain-containing protein [Lachnospiraceae bacterium]
MNIGRMEQGSRLSLIAKKDKKKVMFETRVLRKISPTTIQIDPIRYNHYAVSFAGAKINVEVKIDNAKDHRLYAFPVEKIVSVVNNGEREYYVTASAEAESTNRRGRERFSVNKKGHCSMGDSRANYEVTVKDLSGSGVGLICDKDVSINMDPNFVLRFEDPSLGSKFTVSGQLVRKQAIGDGRYIYGGRFSDESREVNSYLVDLQQHKMM